MPSTHRSLRWGRVDRCRPSHRAPDRRGEPSPIGVSEGSRDY
nr:MAG TPA: hypothetical protein [Caudoviricetes sp.]